MFSAEKAISGSKILVVDDVETNRMILEEIIKDMGCRPVLAESGVEALKLFYEFSPSLVLTDISMPQMDGYELCRVLKADPNSFMRQTRKSQRPTEDCRLLSMRSFGRWRQRRGVSCMRLPTWRQEIPCMQRNIWGD